MNTKVKIMLNDKESITELANDPDVQIKIKNAIVDTIVKRTVKVLNDDIMNQVRMAINKVIEDIKTQKDKTLSDIFEKGDWRGPSLTSTYRDYIRAEARNAMRCEVHEMIKELEVEMGKFYSETYERRKKEIEGYDFDKAVKEYIAKRVSGTIAKLIQ